MKETELFLLQKYDNGDFFVYSWTTILAKKGYKAMTPEQAAPYIKLAKMGKNNVSHVDNKTFINGCKETDQVAGFIPTVPPVEGEDSDDAETQDLIKKVVKSDGTARPLDSDEVRELSVSQEEVQAAEMKYIKSLQHKSSLEAHLLEKYQCEVPTGRLDAMKAIANSMISDLAKDNRLYYVDGQIAVK